MISLQPVKDMAYTLNDILMKSGMYDDEEDEDMIEMDKKGRRPKAKRRQGRPTQQIVQKTTVIVNQADAKRRRRKAKPKQQTRKQEMRTPPSYGISTGASGASFTPFTPAAPLYRNITAASAPTTTDNMTASQKRIENIVSGSVINAIETKADKTSTLTKIENVINTQREKQQTAEDYFESLKPVEKEDGKPPSFEEAIGSVEYKSQEEANRIQQIKEEYERGLTLKNQKNRENKARKQLDELGKMKGRIEEITNLQEDLLKQAERMNKRLIEESKQQQEPEQDQEPEPKKERKQKRTKQEMEEGKMMQEADKQKKREDTQKAFDEFLTEYDQDELEKLAMRNIIYPAEKDIIKDNSTPSDENMSSRVQSFKRGHITPMMPRYF
jgi:hypothetical protein